MSANVYRERAQVMQLVQELYPVRHGGVIGFVVSKPAINWGVRADRLSEVDLDDDRCFGGSRGWRRYGSLGKQVDGAEHRHACKYPRDAALAARHDQV